MGVPLIVFNIPELHELKPYAFADITAPRRPIDGRSWPAADGS
jgi:hypothetical protein